MGTPHFYEHVPSINLRGEMAYFGEGEDRQSCMRIATARALHRRLGAALAVHDNPPANVLILPGRKG